MCKKFIFRKTPKLCLVRKTYASPDDFNVYFDSRLWYKSPICTNYTQGLLCQRQPEHNIVKCSEKQHACTDGTCVSTDYLCDGKYNCLDLADERNCTDICTKGTYLNTFNLVLGTPYTSLLM